MDAEKRQRLLTVYATERQDNQTSLVVAFTIVAAALTYLTVAFSFLSSHCFASGCKEAVRPWMQLAAPAPLVALTGYFVLNTAGTIRRSQLILDLEDELREPVGSKGRKAPRTQRSAALVYGLKVRHPYAWMYSICTLATYGTVVGGVGAFTCFALWPAQWTWNKWLVSALYAVAFLCECGGLLIAVLYRGFATAE